MPEQIKPKTLRTAVYVDGFNLYFGLKSRNWQKYYWLDIWAFGGFLAQERQVVSVKYFTADIDGSEGKVRRQQTFLNALQAHSPRLEIFKGKFLQKKIECRSCLQTFIRNEEKMTDVNIATHLVNDAWKDLFDVAIVVSGDSDLIPPIATVVDEFPGKSVLVAFPPDRFSNHLKSTTTSFFIQQNAFKKSQMPDVVIKPNGSKLHRPPNWH